MVDSIECRWFVQGAMPKQALDWLLSGVPRGDNAMTEERTDWYLRVSSKTLGIKVRGGKTTNVEIKSLITNFRQKEWRGTGGQVLGHLAGWSKWSFTTESRDDLARELGSGWIEIRKRRSLIKFEWSDGKIVATDAANRPESGCGVEITELSTNSAYQWWSLGFEAFGINEQIRMDAIEKSLMRMLQVCPPSLASAL